MITRSFKVKALLVPTLALAVVVGAGEADARVTS